MRSPSSLIFLVLLGVWAAYFVQYWVRRRDHLATARTVEQFSEAMRVLERRDPLPRTDLSEQAPRSYAVHPARANRPQVLVKRAVAAEPAGPPSVTARVAARVTARVTARVGDGRPARAGSVRPRLRPSRRVRGLFVLAAFAELLVITPLVVLGMLPAWALATAVLAIGATLAYLRAGVRGEQAMMRAHRRRKADPARLRSSAPVASSSSSAGHGATRPASARRSAPVSRPARSAAAVEGAPVLGTESATVPGVPNEPATPGAAPSPLDVALEVAPATEAVALVVESSVVDTPFVTGVMVPILDEDDMPLTWDPVPVPRPTYTMKAKAERREVAPAAVTPDPSPVVRKDEDEDTAYDQRRAAGA